MGRTRRAWVKGAGVEMIGENGRHTIEINRACLINVDLVDHIIELCICCVQPQRSHHGTKFGPRDDSCLLVSYLS